MKKLEDDLSGLAAMNAPLHALEQMHPGERCRERAAPLTDGRDRYAGTARWVTISLVAVAIGCGSGSATPRKDDATVAKAASDATVAATRTSSELAVLTLRSVRIFDRNGPEHPDDLPRVTSQYVDATADAKVPVRTDTLMMGVYADREPDVLLDETATFAVRAHGHQSFVLRFDGDYRVLFQCTGFETTADGAAIAIDARFKTNYRIQLPGEQGAAYYTLSFAGTIAVGSSIIRAIDEHRSRQLFLGNWVGVTIDGLASEPPAGAIVVDAQDEAQYARTSDEWQVTERAAFP
jgi:hypothetical protein